MFSRDDGAFAGGTQSVIGAGVVISGEIRFSGGLRIDGKVIGSVRSVAGETGSLVIGEHGCVEGNIDVARQLINGTVAGRVEAREFVRLQPKARVNCDISYGAAEIQPGAIFDGRLVHRAQGVQVDGLLEALESAPLERATASA